MKALVNDIYRQYKNLFDDEPLLVRSPGRINLIGEHTDYNNGFVMPAAIDKEIIFAIGRSTNNSTVYAHDYHQQISVDVNHPARVDSPAWANYLLGVLSQIQSAGHTIGNFNCVFGGDIPGGAGLSSSAALECGFGFAISQLFHLNIPRLDIVKMGQWAEHNYVGVKCGIMDQFASVMGREQQVILLDCQSMEYEYAPLSMRDHVIILCNTKVKHALVDSEYNKRREECEEGVRILRKYDPAIHSLRDVSMKMLQDHRSEMTGKVFARCHYVVGEIARVQAAMLDLKSGDLVAFGRKMFETHEGLSKEYEVSCKELDFLVDEAKKLDIVLGSRMMGGGFGGCTINLVRQAEADQFIDRMSASYKKQFGIDMPSYRVSIKEGTSILAFSPKELTHA